MNLNGSPVAVRSALLEFFPELVTIYGSTAAVLGSDFYDMLRVVPPSAAAFRAASAQPVEAAVAAGSARWALGALFAEDTELFTSQMRGATQRLVQQPFRETVFTAASKDPVRTGVARVPAGSTTCRFCVMLASRGAVYHTSESAGQSRTFHDNCDCMSVVVRSAGDYPEGYDLGAMKTLYAEQSGIGRDIPAAL